MTSTVFVDNTTLVPASWLNDINSVAYNILGNGTVIPANAAAARTNLGLGNLAVINSPLPVANGGTGQSSYTDGQLLIGNTTGNTLDKATLTAGSGIAITNGAGSVTVALDAATITSGTYTPTAGNFVNVNLATVLSTRYIRIGSVVTVAGEIQVTIASGTTTTSFTLSLPFASTFANAWELSGTMGIIGAVAGDGISAGFYADTTHHLAGVTFTSNAAFGITSYSFIFNYIII